MTSSDNNVERRIVRRAAKLSKNDNPPKTMKVRSRDQWEEYLTSQTELSDTMKRVVRRQGYSQNCAKPMGLYFGVDALVATQDPQIASGSAEQKRRSFIESFRWHAEEMNWREPISSEAIIPEVAKLIEISELPTPAESLEELTQYVEQVYRKRRIPSR